jgi:hypothetical protein
MRWVVALGLLAFAFLPAFMLIGRGEDASTPRLMVAELGDPRQDAPLVRRPAPGVAVHVERSGFEGGPVARRRSPWPASAPTEPDGPAVATPHTGGAAPETTTQSPRKPLAAAPNFIGAKHRRSLGLVMILLSMGCAVGFLIMVELQRILPAPRG